jgi:hypothetical protein
LSEELPRMAMGFDCIAAASDMTDGTPDRGDRFARRN